MSRPNLQIDAPRRVVETARLALFFFACVFLSGCGGHTEYVIEMKPEGGQLIRKLSIIDHAPPPPTTNDAPAQVAASPEAPENSVAANVEPEDFPECLRKELGRIEKLYTNRNSNYPSNIHIFQGSFSGKLPNDVGGAGSYLFYSNSLGTASVYVERFRGNDDPAGQLQKQARAIDLWLDHLIAWSKLEFGAKPSFEKLRVFLDQNLRQDLKNLGLYAVRGEVLSANSSEAKQTEFAFRAGLYLVERGYFKITEIPEVLRWFNEDDETAGLRVAQRLLADKMGIEPAELSIFEDLDAFEKSGDAYLRSTPEYRELVKDWEAAKKDDPELEKPDPGEVIATITEPLGDSIVIFRTDDGLSLTLSLPGPALYTNGEWDDGKLVWARRIEGDDAVAAPALCYATWVTPNDKIQRRLFGETILNGETLFEVCLQHAGLNEKERRDWENLLEKVPPVAEWKPQFDALRAQLEAEAAKRGDPIGKDEISSQAWDLIRSKLPELFGEPN